MPDSIPSEASIDLSNFKFFGEPHSSAYKDRAKILDEVSSPEDAAARIYCERMVYDGHLQELLRETSAFVERFKDNRNAALLAGVIAELSGQKGRSERYENSFLSLGGSKNDYLLASAKFWRIANEPDRYMSLMLKWASNNQADKSKALFQYALICMQYQALDRVREAISLSDESSIWTDFLAAIMEAAEGRQADLDTRLERWIKLSHTDVRFVNFVEVLWTQSNHPSLFDKFVKIAEPWIDHPKVIGRALLNKLVVPSSSRNSALPKVQHIEVRYENLIDVVDALIEHGEFVRARKLLNDAPPFTDDFREARRSSIERFLNAIPKETALQRQIVVDDPHKDWIVSDPTPGKKRCVVFTGLNGKPTVGVETLDRFLAAWGYQSLFVRDFNRLAYAKGIASCGPDKSHTINALADFTRSEDSNTPVFIGASLGSNGALNFGLELKVPHIVLLGYHSRDNKTERWRLGNSRAPLLNVRERLFRATNAAPSEDSFAAANHDFEVDLFFGDANPIDTFYATGLSKLSSVRAHPVSGLQSHDIMRPLLTSGRLASALPE